MEYINNKLEEFKRYIKAKNVAIIGLGVSNIPLINYLYNLGAIITVFDQKTEAELNEEALELTLYFVLLVLFQQFQN